MQAVPMYQVFGIHPGFSGEKYQRVRLSAPEEPAACTVAEPARISEQNDGQGLTAVPTIQATPPATSVASRNTARTVLPSAAAPAGSAVEKDVPVGPSQLSAGGMSSVMDLDLDNLLAATSPAKLSGTGTHAQRSRQATAASSTSWARGSQQSRQTPGKDAKKVLEDWLDL